MKQLRFAVFGAGFWSHYQLAGWRELKGIQCVAVYNRTRAKAEALAAKFDIPAVYDDAEELLRTEKLDFVDVITEIGGHEPLVRLAAKHGVPMICQKPMAADFATATRMVKTCERARVPFFIHENWRWQEPIRQLSRILKQGDIGEPFRARVDMNSGFPVFQNQPFLRTLEQFIITDLGSHTLDAVRFLFGEAATIYCHTQRVHDDIKGEDVATVLLRMQSGASVAVNMAYAENPLEHEAFPQTCFFIEGTRGSISVEPDYWIRVTTRRGTLARRYPPLRYSWANPAYDVVHASIVACNANLLGQLQGRGRAETTGADNLKTMRLVYAAYESAAANRVVKV